MSRRLSLTVASIFLFILNPVFASTPIHESDYVAVLTDPSDGMAILEAAQDGMLSMNNSDIIKKMIDLAVKASTGTYSNEQLQKFDAEFQQDKQKYAALLSKQTLGGSLIFNQGSFSIVKNNIKYVIDLAPKNTAALGISSDNLQSIDSAKTAINHVTAAINNITHWIPQGAENNSASAITKKVNTQTNNYFDSSVLYIKSPAGAETALQSIEMVRNRLSNLLTQMASLASQATSESISQETRENLNIAFSDYLSEIDRVVAWASFANIKAFDGSTLVVHDTKQGDKAYDLPVLNLTNLGVADDNVASNAGGQAALQDLFSIHDKLSIWLVDGVFNPLYVSSRVINAHQ